MVTKKKPVKKPMQPDEWTEKKILVWLRSALRSASRRYPPLYAALAAAKEPYTVKPDEAGYSARQKFQYRCAACGGAFSGKEVALDHRDDCGSLLKWGDLQGFASRLFCQQDGLDVLCHQCHDVKTLMSKNGMSKEEATTHKAVLSFEKEHNIKQIVDYCQKHGYNSCTNQMKRREALTDIFNKQSQAALHKEKQDEKD